MQNSPSVTTGRHQLFVVFTVVLLILSACQSGPTPWQVATQLDSIEAYDAYLSQDPDGPFVGEAKERIKDKLWTVAVEKDSREGYQDYLQRFPASERHIAATEALCGLDWQDASEVGTRDAIEAFLAQHPVCPFVPDAQAALTVIETEEAEQARLAAKRAHEAAAAAAFENIRHSENIEDWDAFVMQYHATELAEVAGKKLESFEDLGRFEHVRQRAKKGWSNSIERDQRRKARDRFILANVVLEDQINDDVAILFKQADYTYVSTEEYGDSASDAAAKNLLLRRARPGEFYVLQVTPEALFGDGEALQRSYATAIHRVAAIEGSASHNSSWLSLGSPNHLWPDPNPNAPGGLGLVPKEHGARSVWLTMAFGPSELAAVLHRLPEDLGAWARDRIRHAGWKPTSNKDQALFAVLDSNLSALRGLGAEAETAALEVWVQGHTDVRARGEAMLRALDPNNADERYAWRSLATDGSVVQLEDYLDRFPQGLFSADVRARRSAILSDDTPYLEAVESGNLWNIKQFLEDYPGHAREHEARDLVQGSDLFHLIDTGRILVEIRGRGIEAVTIRARPLVAEPVSVRVPVGAVFEAADRQVQDMVTRNSTVSWLKPYEWQELEINVVCANIHRDVPYSSDVFTLLRQPAGQLLQATLAILAKSTSSGAPFDITQAATWILTDDVSYDELGELRTQTVGNAYTSGARSIDEHDTLLAMRAIHEAGGDITERKIWLDRERLVTAADDAELATWIDQLRLRR